MNWKEHRKAWRVCWQQWVHRSHCQQLNLGHGRRETWVEATEIQGNTISWRQKSQAGITDKQRKKVKGGLIHSDRFCESSIKAAQVSVPFVHGNKRQDVELPGNSLSCKQLQCHREEEMQVSISNCVLPA